MAEQEINRDVLIQLPIWAQQRITRLMRTRSGRKSQFHVIMQAFDYDIDQTDVEFIAGSMVELRRQLAKYQKGCLRYGIHYTFK